MKLMIPGSCKFVAVCLIYATIYQDLIVHLPISCDRALSCLMPVSAGQLSRLALWQMPAAVADCM